MFCNSSTRRTAIVLLLVFLTSPARLAGQAEQEASRARILLVLDTDDRMGDTWGLDGENMKDMLEATLKKQKLEGRFTLDVFTGSQVTPQNILRYYANLNVAKSEALLFYYSGHGGFHVRNGHYLALHWGNLYRAELRAAMNKHDARLVVLLTDCCANMTGATAVHKEPPNVTVGPTEGRDSPQDAVRLEEPTGAVVTSLTRQAAPVKPRPLQGTHRAKNQEPPFEIHEIKEQLFQAQPRAKVEEPPGPATGKGNQLITGSGTVPLQDILDKTDGLAMRHLLFRKQGLVDINGCKKGALSHGTRAWGGSLFTNALLALQKEPLTVLDKNGNQVIEWEEFFPLLSQGTKAAGQKARVVQEPEMFHFAGPLALTPAENRSFRPPRIRP